MSYPNYFTPRGWRLEEGDDEVFKERIAEGAVTQTPEVQAAWQEIADTLIEAIDLFKEMVDGDVGIVQVVFQGNPELDEHKMMINIHVKQRAYGQTGPEAGPNNWPMISSKFGQITVQFEAMVAGDVGTAESDIITSVTPHEMMMKYFIAQKQEPEAFAKMVPHEIHHRNPPSRERIKGFPK